jgi:hypothetical protein
MQEAAENNDRTMDGTGLSDAAVSMKYEVYMGSYQE